MGLLARGRGLLLGGGRPRRVLLVSTGVLLSLASVAFLLGANIGFFEIPWVWLSLMPLLPFVAGVLRAGLLPAVVSLWLVRVWLHVFPPLVGYLSGAWTGTGRYTTPRRTAYMYGSARAELLGGLETTLQFGVAFAFVVGTVAYGLGALLRSVTAGGKLIES
ncbi:hypothetical protein [Salarchaeum japonicum]|uniref:DUF2062 domain-containing protein n=1 Tax=Salarchaeum japonicum TaxID=555573 RepID=A0AAV3T121_9EURY|nr:hypothetical protein [Salarchaeum japonicum]